MMKCDSILQRFGQSVFDRYPEPSKSADCFLRRTALYPAELRALRADYYNQIL